MRFRAAVTASALLLASTACSKGTTAEPLAPRAPLDGPTRLEAEVPVGYPQSPDGARTAAIRYVAVLGGALGLDPSRRDLALAAVSRNGQPPPAIMARWATRPNVERATGVQDALRSGSPVVAAAVPVMSRVTAYDDHAATVAVWVAAVLGTERLGSLDQSWSTETVTLQWSGDWKLVAYESAPGPIPALHQPVTSLAEALAATQGMAGIFDVAP
ncbi:MAG: hypothetical protein WD794_13200 [Mycobacteriales bacterium]